MAKLWGQCSGTAWISMTGKINHRALQSQMQMLWAAKKLETDLWHASE